MSGSWLHNVGSVIKVVFARLRFVAVFVVAALVVGYWDSIVNHWDKWTRPETPAASAAEQSNVEYYCAMHPNIVRAEPGSCPICAMPLVKRLKGQKTQLPEDVLSRVQLSPQRLALGNIQTTAVEDRELWREIRAVGVLDYDETKVAQLSARVAGRADELYVQYAGKDVHAGQPLYSLYSPEVYTARREYMLARRRVNQIPADAGPEVRSDAGAVYNAALQKLVLWGVTRSQLDEMDKACDDAMKAGKEPDVPIHLQVISPIEGTVIRKDIFEGGYLQVGDRPYTIANLKTLWLKAKIYEADVTRVRERQIARIVVAALGNKRIEGRVAFVAFQIDPQTRTLDARIEVKNDDLQLRPGMFAEASIEVPVMPGDAPAPAPPTTAPAPLLSPARVAEVFASAAGRYVEAQKLLAADKSAGVVDLLHETLRRLQPIAEQPQIRAPYGRLSAAIDQIKDDEIESLRKKFVDVSAAMIEIGKQAGMPADAPAVQVFHCPMYKADWLQSPGSTANPYYGSKMLACGAAVESLPKAAAGPAATQPAPIAVKVPAVPRSAVVDTGHRKIVYVESAPGVFDMRAIDVGSPAGEYYPVLAGVRAGERVVTVGTFLVDSENRLNPAE